MTSYQEIKHESLICVQKIIDVEVYLGISESYLEVRI